MTKNALVVAHQRGGGTLLCHFLSNHPQVFCPRDEPLHDRSVYKQLFRAKDEQIARAIWQTPGYRLTMFKTTYQQFAKELLKDDLRIVHLYRQNVLRTVISRLIMREYRAGTFPNHRSHTVGVVGPVRLKVDIGYVLDACNKLQVSQERMKKTLEGQDVFTLTYEALTNGKTEIQTLAHALTGKLCSFLGVNTVPLSCELRRVNRYPLSEVVDNWDELRSRFAGTVYARFTEGE